MQQVVMVQLKIKRIYFDDIWQKYSKDSRIDDSGVTLQ